MLFSASVSAPISWQVVSPNGDAGEESHWIRTSLPCDSSAAVQLLEPAGSVYVYFCACYSEPLKLLQNFKQIIKAQEIDGKSLDKPQTSQCV